ncbi:MerB-like organometallic lyase SaoL [Desulfopila sp. IMCC35008]|uniref:MerB-like organometallic lyase SaoL n=1 Tax=Desulfopila sp. IMCC35008 TaxID=2653858 RepID=UPI0013D88D1A|nr:MerB-like organometallic lyase SaoL [Desulfopila sp. IMCC35008]
MNTFKDNSIDKLYMDSINSRLSQDAKKARIAILNFSIDQKKPFNIIEDKTAEIDVVLQELIDRQAMIVSEDGNVDFIFPVSTKPTQHKVSLQDGREFFAMCAIDALGSAFTFDCATKINSVCAHCNEPVAIEVRNGSVAYVSCNELRALHVDLNKSDDWSGSC